ncbi:hypothetical protein CI41S_04390 [Bradyrhizobium ivorense]|nr:hypothetical protein CI41S_04390 [Bradyrhizobium ivorense]
MRRHWMRCSPKTRRQSVSTSSRRSYQPVILRGCEALSSPTAVIARPVRNCAHGPGDPVRRGLSLLSPASLEYWITRSSRVMTPSKLSKPHRHPCAKASPLSLEVRALASLEGSTATSGADSSFEARRRARTSSDKRGALRGDDGVGVQQIWCRPGESRDDGGVCRATGGYWVSSSTLNASSSCGEMATLSFSPVGRRAMNHLL